MSKVDLVTVSPDGGAVQLHVVRDAPWTGSDEELAAFRQKIHAYVGYAIDGQMSSDYPETRGLPWVVLVHSMQGPPEARVEQSLVALRERVDDYGGRLEHRLGL